jgi:hypothetical protein
MTEYLLCALAAIVWGGLLIYIRRDMNKSAL